MELSKKLLNFIRRRRLIAPGQSLLIGVSGGPDSVALAHLMHRLRHELSVSLHILHFNHRLRTDAGKDQECVEALGRQLNIPVTVGVRKGVLKGKASEEQARDWRLRFFADMARSLKADAVLVAHTQNDAAETVLMRLLRGSGLYGLRGILPERELGGVTIIRPMIEISRQEVEVYIRRHQLAYCVDKSNAQTHFTRNKVRLELLPLLAKEYNPGITDVLLDLARTAGEDVDFLQGHLAQRVKKNVASSQGTVRIKISFLDKEHPAMRRLVLRHAFELLTGDVRQMTFAHIVEAEDLLANRPLGSIVHWPRSVRVVKKKAFLEVSL